MAEPRLPEQHEYQQLGAYLRDLRAYFALDVMEVSRRTHIRTKYIQAIEDEQLDVMPGRVYARGYVVTYAEFFGLNAEDFANRYMAQFGVTQTPTKEEPTYFVPEPTRRRLSKSNSNMVIAGVLLMLAGFAGWALMGGEQQPQEPTVAAVPERLIEQLRTGVMLHPSNAECLLGTSHLLACLDAKRVPMLPSYVQKPAMLFVEGAELEAVIDAEEASTAEAETTEETTTEAPQVPAAAAPATTEAPKIETQPAERAEPQPTQPATTVVAPAPVVAPAANTTETAAPARAAAPAPETTPKVATEAPVVVPFKRQGEEAPPSGEAETQAAPPENTSAAPAASQTTEGNREEPSDSLLPKEWFEADEPNYQDPNARQDEGWSPRDRRR